MTSPIAFYWTASVIQQVNQYERIRLNATQGQSTVFGGSHTATLEVMCIHHDPAARDYVSICNCVAHFISLFSGSPIRQYIIVTYV
jgi:hypothetical protein